MEIFLEHGRRSHGVQLRGGTSGFSGLASFAVLCVFEGLFVYIVDKCNRSVFYNSEAPLALKSLNVLIATGIRWSLLRNDGATRLWMGDKIGLAITAIDPKPTCVSLAFLRPTDAEAVDHCPSPCQVDTTM